MTRTLSIGITTKDRPEALRACVESLALLDHLSPEVLIYDDGSKVPVERQLGALATSVRILEQRPRNGLVAGRNRLVAAAGADVVLLLDDDTRLLTAEAVESAIETIRRDPRVGAVAFAQAEADGRPWPVDMQPSRATSASLVASFIGFAHLLRRSTFMGIGGYREALGFYGEEKEFCLRLLDSGYVSVYLPDSLIAHVPDPSGRSQQRYLRLVSRNDCFNTLYNDPMTRLLWMLPARFALYFRMRRGWKIRDPWGGMWLLRELVAGLPDVLAHRRPVSRRTLAEWQTLRRGDTPYLEPSAESAGQHDG